MKPSYGSALGIGAIAGLVLALCALLFAGATGGIPKLTVVTEGSTIEPSFAVPASALWMVSIITAAVCGVLLAVITRAVSRALDPATRGASIAILAVLGAFVAAATTFAVLPLGVTVLGSLAEGTATVSIAGMTALVSIIGVVGGALIVWQSYILSRPPQPIDDPDLLAT